VAGARALIWASLHIEAQWLLGLRQARLKILLINSNLPSGSFPKRIQAGIAGRIGGALAGFAASFLWRGLLNITRAITYSAASFAFS
jgi:hypothetical protein